MIERCAHCHELAPLGELIEVTAVADPRQRFRVHRPSVREGCFRLKVNTAAIHAIALADPRLSQTGVPG